MADRVLIIDYQDAGHGYLRERLAIAFSVARSLRKCFATERQAARAEAVVWSASRSRQIPISTPRISIWSTWTESLLGEIRLKFRRDFVISTLFLVVTTFVNHKPGHLY